MKMIDKTNSFSFRIGIKEETCTICYCNLFKHEGCLTEILSFSENYCQFFIFGNNFFIPHFNWQWCDK